jgi:undecaprenyl-diphosphatase
LSFTEAVLLGVLQGLTEFLPVSSSGHLVIAQGFLPGFRQPGVLFDLVLHGGTLVAVVFFLRGELAKILAALLPRKGKTAEEAADRAVSRRLLLLLAAATVVTGILGLPFRNEIEGFFSSPRAAAFFLLVTGALLYFAGGVPGAGRKEKDLNLPDALVIGIAQAAALLPGISRSGATISFALFRKIDGETAASFSFLLSIPAILGAFLLEAGHLDGLPGEDLAAYGAGFLAAMVTGFFALKLLYLVIRGHRLRIFSYYCWAAGAAALIAGL